VILITKKLILLTKPKKDIKNQEKSTSVISWETCQKHVLTCWSEIKPKKAMRQLKKIVYWLESQVKQELCVVGGISKRGCAPLWERWRTPRGGCLPLERWCPSCPLVAPCVNKEEVWERWQLHLPHLASPFLSKWCALPP
jgi:hypothetical protein